MKRLQTRIPPSISKSRLDEFLAEWLPQALGQPVSRGKIRNLIFNGAVYVNRHRNKNGLAQVFSGAVIEVYYDEDRLNANQVVRKETVRFDSARIVFEDEWIIVVDKPAGIPTQPTVDPNRANLFDLLGRFLSERAKVEKAYVGLHHRLDRDTSGLVLFTKKEEANKGVADLFSGHQIQKTYHCLCWRPPGTTGYETDSHFQVDNYLGKISEKSEKSKFGSVDSGGDRAITDFRVIENFRDALWLEAKPKTGRTHQIRVHCAGLSLPILGDDLYFPKGVSLLQKTPRMMLHALKLSFKHPITQKEMEVATQLPDEMLQVLEGLKA